MLYICPPNGGCSSGGRAPDCGSGGRGFESHQSPFFSLLYSYIASPIMKGFAHILIALLFCGLIRPAAHADPIRKGLKAIKHHNYKVAFSQLTQAWVKDSSNKRIHYAWAVFWSDPENLSTDNKLAFEYIHRAWDLKSQRNPLFGYKVKTRKLRKLALRLDSLHFNQAMKRESEPETRHYLKYAVNSDLINQAQIRLVDFAWVEAKATGQYQYLEAYRKEFPQSKYDSLAFGLGALWRYKECEVGLSIECLKELVDLYPQHPLAANAQATIHQFAFAKAERENTAGAFRRFMDAYPEAPQIGKAKDKLLRLEIDEIQPANDYRSFLSFAQNNPNHPYINEALNIAYDLYTADQSDPDRMLMYIREFPQSPFYLQACAVFFNLYTEQGTKVSKVKEFLSRFPELPIGELGKRALFMIETDQLQSLEKIKKYIQKNPQGDFLKEAHLALYNIVTDYQKDFKPLQKFAQDYPESPYAAQSKYDYYLLFTDKESNLERARIFVQRFTAHPFLGQSKHLAARLSAEKCEPTDSVINMFKDKKYGVEHFVTWLTHSKKECYTEGDREKLMTEAEKAYPESIAILKENFHYIQ